MLRNSDRESITPMRNLIAFMPGNLNHYHHVDMTRMSMFATNALLGGGVRIRILIREQRSKEDQRHY